MAAAVKLTTLTFLLFSGTVFFTLLFVLLVKILKLSFPSRLTAGDIYTIAMRSVSAIQATVASCIGIFIVSSVKDPIKDRHYLADYYIVFALPYFYYDVWAMYKAYYHNLSDDMKHGAIFSWETIKSFVKTYPLMMVHHTILPVIYFPVLIYLRQGRGDFFVGCFFLIELAVPFISFRAILLQLRMKDSVLYMVNGIAMIVVFGVCRILIFPFMFSYYGAHIGVPFWKVSFHIPIKCTISCVILLILQVYWWYSMIVIAIKTIKHLLRKKVQ